MEVNEKTIKTILGGWIGIYNLVAFQIGKEYEYKCDYTVCKKPSNFDELSKPMDFLLKENPIDKENIKNNSLRNELYSLRNINSKEINKALQTLSDSNAIGTLDPQNCTLYYSSSQTKYKYVPINCIQKFDKGARIFNNLDNNTYILIDWADPITAASMRPTIIVQMENTNILFVMFGWGSVPPDPMIMDEYNVERIINFIADKLFPHISENYMIILGGHSDGMVNAFFVAEIIRLIVNNSINPFLIKIRQKFRADIKKIEEEYESTENKIKLTPNIETDLLNKKITTFMTARDNYINTLTTYLNNMITNQSDENVTDLLKLFKDWINSFSDMEKYMRESYINEEFNKIKKLTPKCPNSPRPQTLFFDPASIYISDLKYDENLVYGLSTSDNEKIRNWSYKFVDMIPKLMNIVSDKDRKYILTYIDRIWHNENEVMNGLFELNENELILDILEWEVDSCDIIFNQKKEDMLNKVEKIRNFDKLYDIHNNIFICGSAGYPCFGENLMNYAELKKFYHGRILHFRRPADFYLESFLGKYPTIHRSDLVSFTNDNVIFYDADTLKKEQTQINYSQIKPILSYHEWNAYKLELADVYKNDELINKLLSFVDGAKIYGGDYYSKYIKYKMKYINLKSSMIH